MMQEVSISALLVKEMHQHAVSAYPEECCGFLIGLPGESTREVHRIREAPNRMAAERERRYSIPPGDLRSLESELEGTGVEVVGFYHSHPDHPARPSAFDRDHAWPWYTYVVLSVQEGATMSFGAFELDPDTQEFREVPIRETGEIASPKSNGGVSESS